MAVWQVSVFDIMSVAGLLAVGTPVLQAGPTALVCTGQTLHERAFQIHFWIPNFASRYRYVPLTADVVEHTQHRPIRNVFTKFNKSKRFPLNKSNRHHWHSAKIGGVIHRCNLVIDVYTAISENRSHTCIIRSVTSRHGVIPKVGRPPAQLGQWRHGAPHCSSLQCMMQ